MENEKPLEQSPSEDAQLAGLLKNRDAILAEKKALQDRLTAAETERATLSEKLAQYEPKATEAEALRAQLAEAQQAAPRPSYSALDTRLYHSWTQQAMRSWQEGLDAYLADTGAV